jgi:hypothetical protein
MRYVLRSTYTNALPYRYISEGTCSKQVMLYFVPAAFDMVLSCFINREPFKMKRTHFLLLAGISKSKNPFIGISSA